MARCRPRSIVQICTGALGNEISHTEHPRALLLVFGSIWFLQGINVLPGSFMTGQIRWAVYDGIAGVVGIALLVKADRRSLTRQR